MIELRGLTKTFGQVQANAGIHLRALPGTIHGVIGENGAGKSTAMKMLYGIYSPDEGEILVDGKPRQWRSPADAIAAGIGMVHQHFMLAGPYTALDNVLLGDEPTKVRWIPKAFAAIDRRGARRRLEALSKQYGMPVDWSAPIEKLPVGIQQRIEILKLLYRDARVLILDEPTAVLTPQETGELFENLKKLKAQGKTIIIITHKLKEVMSATDRVTVFRAGRVTGEVKTSETSPQDLANLMVGRKVVLAAHVPMALTVGGAALEAKGLSLVDSAGGKPKLNQVNLTVHQGEIVGIAGVEGNGQSELLQALLHPSEPGVLTSGEVAVLGKPATEMNTREIKDLGVGVIPEDRHHEGLLLERPVDENFLLGLQRSEEFSRKGFIAFQKLRERAAHAIEEYDVRPRSLEIATGRMSGGNQQKLIIAREFERKPGFLFAAQPTRGVDVGAIEFIHQRIVRARDEGAGVLLVSSELDEVLALSDRILVMYEGQIVAEYQRGKVSERELGLRMGGAKAQEGARA
jgi:simple sugar transport system ATP-binding protein